MTLLLFVSLFPVYRSLRHYGYITKGLRDLIWFFWLLLSDKIWPPDERELRRRRRRPREPPKDDPELESGSAVVVSFRISSAFGKEVPTGSRGTVEKIYEKDGDALVEFEGIGRICVKKTDFGRLIIEKKVCPWCHGQTCKACAGTGMVSAEEKIPELLWFRISLLAYFVLLVAIIVVAKPEEQVSTGFHQGWGSCDAVSTDILKRERHDFACSEHYQRAWFNIECPRGTPPAQGSSIYTICGLSYDSAERLMNYADNVLGVSAVSLLGVASCFFALTKDGPRRREHKA